MPVSWSTRETVYTGSKREPAQVDPLGAQPSLGATQPPSPSQTHPQFTWPLYDDVKRPTRVQLPVLQATNARCAPGRRPTFLASLGGSYKRHAARIDTVSCHKCGELTTISAGTRMGAIECPQRPYPASKYTGWRTLCEIPSHALDLYSEKFQPKRKVLQSRLLP